MRTKLLSAEKVNSSRLPDNKFWIFFSFLQRLSYSRWLTIGRNINAKDRYQYIAIAFLQRFIWFCVFLRLFRSSVSQIKFFGNRKKAIKQLKRWKRWSNGWRRKRNRNPEQIVKWWRAVSLCVSVCLRDNLLLKRRNSLELSFTMEFVTWTSGKEKKRVEGKRRKSIFTPIWSKYT